MGVTPLYGLFIGLLSFHRAFTGSVSGRVIPTNKPNYSCKYSTGVDLTVLGLLVMQLQLPDKEGITNYNILFVPTRKNPKMFPGMNLQINKTLGKVS